MASTKIPQSQLDSLPLQDAEEATNPGTVTIIGGQVSRFFTPAQTGINAAVRDTTGGYYYVLGAYLDLSGCNTFTAMITRTINTGAAKVALPALFLWYQFLPSTLITMPVILAGVGLSTMANGQGVTNTTGHTMPAIGAGATQYNLHSWHTGQTTSAGDPGNTNTHGPAVRLILYFGTSDPDNGYALNEHNLFSLYLWAQT